MSVKLTTRQVGDVTVVDVAGRITLGEGSATLRDAMRDMVSKNQKKILLNLGEVSYIDSGGLGQLVSSYGSLAKTSGGLKLLHVNKRNHDLLSITRLVTIFDTFDSEDEAVKSFAPAALA